MSQIGYDVSRFDVPNMYGSRSIIECPSTWKGTFDSGYLIPFFGVLFYLVILCHLILLFFVG